MITSGFLFAAVRAAMIAMTGGLIFLLILRKYKGINPNAHRLIWFGVLLLGLCIVQFPIDVPYYEAQPATTAVLQTQSTPTERPTAVPDETQPVAIPETMTAANIPATFANSPKNIVTEQNAIQAAETQPAVEQIEAPRISIPMVLVAIWLGGIAMLFLRRVFLFVRLHLKLWHLEPAVAPEWERLLKQFGIAPERIPVLWTENSGPALVRSIFGHRLLFPRSLWDELSPVHREGVLRHELAHYLGNDALVMELARMLASVQWFNPISRVALRKLEEATEWRCDDFAYFNRESGPQELIETLLAVHESTESLGLYLSSFARINVITRINRLLHIQSRKENTLMKKLILPTLFLTLLTCSLLQVNLVAKVSEIIPETTATETKATETTAPAAATADPEVIGSPPADPAKTAEPERLIHLAESMIALPDITMERLADVLNDLEDAFRVIRVENHVVYKKLEEKLLRTKVKVCEKMLTMNPNDAKRGDLCRTKENDLFDLVILFWQEKDIAALEHFAEECEAMNFSGSKKAARYARERAKSAKIAMLERKENKTADDYLKLRAEMVDYFENHDVMNDYIAYYLVVAGEELFDKNVITKQQLLETCDRLIAAMPSEDNEFKGVRRQIEQKKTLLTLPGQTIDITGNTIDGKTLDWNAFKGKNVLIAFSSTSYGAKEMGEILRFQQEFAGKNLDFIACIEVSPSSQKINTDENWVETVVKRYDYPGKVAYSLESDSVDLSQIVDFNAFHEYKYIGRTFLLVGEDGKVISLANAAKTRDQLVKLFGEPSDRNVQAGNQKAEAFTRVPLPCRANLLKIMTAMHHYHDIL